MPISQNNYYITNNNADHWSLRNGNESLPTRTWFLHSRQLIWRLMISKFSWVTTFLNEHGSFRNEQQTWTWMTHIICLLHIQRINNESLKVGSPEQRSWENSCFVLDHSEVLSYRWLDKVVDSMVRKNVFLWNFSSLVAVNCSMKSF